MVALWTVHTTVPLPAAKIETLYLVLSKGEISAIFIELIGAVEEEVSISHQVNDDGSIGQEKFAVKYTRANVVGSD